MTKLESTFQKEVIDEVKKLFPGCMVIKNDPNYIQGFPDLTIFYNSRWAVLEVKKNKNASHQPNQDYYVDKLNKMGFCDFIYPENKDKVLNNLYYYFCLKGGRL